MDLTCKKFIRVGLPLKEGGKSYVDALQIGEYCLHKYLLGDEDPDGVWWAVTHVASGRKINPSELLFKYAVEMAENLNNIGVKISESGEISGDITGMHDLIQQIMMENLLVKEGLAG